MIARILILTLIAMLALPVTMLTPTAAPGQPAGSNSAVEAKGKKHTQKKNDKNKHKKPKTTTVTRTVRQPVTQTFTSTGPIAIPNGAPSTTKGPANPYPSAVAVSGFNNGTITDVNLILTDFTQADPYDVDILLNRSDGRRALVMSDRGGGYDVVNLDLMLDDEAAAELPDAEVLTSGTFRPTNVGSSDDTFAAPAPAPDDNVALSTFDGADPNGTWQLWVMDDGSFGYGDLAGWALQITAEVDVQVQEQVKAKKHKKKGKGGKKGKR